MKKLVLIACCLLICLMATSAYAANSVVVESRGFNTSQTLCTLGVWVTNDVALTGFTMPLELRSLSGGAYFTNNLTTTVPFNTQAGGRLINSPLGNADPNGAWPAANITRSAFDVAAANTCSGPVSNSYATAGNNFLASSPDAIFFATVSQGDPAFELITLDPGADGAARNQASFRFLFNANASTGCFEIDTCCRTPANHLVGVDVDVNEVLFAFTKGVVSLGGANCSGPPPNTAPNAICQNIQVAANGSCQGTATAAQVNNGSSDTEDGTNLILALTPAGPYALGANPVSLIVTDQGGKADTCAATITVVDQTAPVLNCPSNIAVQCGNAVPAAYANAAALISAGGTVTDNCPSPTVALLDQVSDNNTCPNVITRRYVATDGAGNKDTCTQTVTVDDTQNPVITDCPNDTTINLPNGQTSTQVLFSDASITDNCNSVNIIHSPLSNSTFNEGTTQVRLIASDLCGNADTCFFNVTIVEAPPGNTKPTAICQNVQVGTDANCQGTATAAQVNNGSNDAETAPGNLVLTLVPAGPYALGANQVQLIVTDQGGLADTCDATITVVDDDNPSISCPSGITVACMAAVPVPYANLAAFISAGGSASDNCDQSLTFSNIGDVPTGSCPTIITRTYRVMDDIGNFVNCQQVIRVNDSIPPVVTCRTDTVITIPPGTAPKVVNFTPGSAVDNCTVSPSIVATPASGSSFPLGVTLVTVIATDDCGKKDTCTFNVTINEQVVEKVPPVAICQNINVNADANCQGNGSVNNGSFDPDGGSLTLQQIPAGPYGLGANPVMLIVTDDEGAKDTCNATVTVNDVTKPVPTCPSNIVVSTAPGLCSQVVQFAGSATDNCDQNIALVYTPPSGSIFPKGVTNVKMVATDDAGNKDSCLFTVTVNDNEPPVAYCVDSIRVPNDPGGCTATVNWTNSIGNSDNCGIASSVFTPAPGSVFPLGTTQVKHVVTDSSGNRDSCYFSVIVHDTSNPTVNCPNDIKVFAPFGQQSAVVTYVASASDCGGLTSFNCTPASGSSFPIGQTTVWCVAEDNAGNRDSCSFTVTVNPGSVQAPGPHTETDTLAFKVTCECDTQSIGVYCVEDPAKGGDPAGCLVYIQTQVPGISASPVPAQAPGSIDIIGCGGNLAPGSYSGWVFFHAALGAKSDSFWVVLQVNPDQPGLDVAPDTLEFTYTGDLQEDKLCKLATINSTGCAEQCWQFVGQSGDWIWVDPTSGTTPDQIEVCVFPCTLGVGVYYQTLTFCACTDKGDGEPGPVGFCDQLVVKLTVVNPAPALVVDPLEIHFEIDCEKKALPVPVYVNNGGGGVLDWYAFTEANWFIIEPDAGDAPDTFYVSIIPDSIPCPNVCDTLLDSICVTANKGCALNSPQYVLVELIICPGDTVICDSICGYVTDCDCERKGDCGIDGATVELWSSFPDGEIIAVDTAVSGAFCFGVEPGVEYDIRFWKKGYCTDVYEDWSCEDGFLNFCLEPLDFILPETPIFHDYYSQNATWEGNLILPGDVIYACDSNGVIVGLAYVEVPGTYLIHVLGNVPKVVDTVDEGADPGEKVSLWLNCKCPVIVNEGFVNFGNTLFDAAWDCRPTGICCELCPGWNMFSYNVYLNDYSRENVLATIDLNYDAVRSGYCDEPTSPHLESWFGNRPVNDLTDVNPWHGYDIHMTTADTLCIEGSVIPADAPIYLCEGWNYVPYFPMEADSREHALQSIAGNYTNVFNLWCDNFDSYNATRPEGANDLFCLYPCRGYWIKMSSEDTLIYPTDGYDCSEPLPKSVPSYISGSVKGSPVVADFWSNSGLNAGDIIEVFSESGMLIGEAQVGSGGMFLLHVFGDVPYTPEVEGAQDGEELTFRVNGLAASVEGNTRFGDRENSQVTVRVSGANPIPDEYALLQNYPNPFNAGTVIPFTMKDASEWTLTVYNIMGQTVQTFEGFDAPGTVRVNWNGLDRNGANVPSGVYFYRVSTGTWTATKKMTLLK